MREVIRLVYVIRRDLSRVKREAALSTNQQVSTTISPESKEKEKPTIPPCKQFPNPHLLQRRQHLFHRPSFPKDGIASVADYGGYVWWWEGEGGGRVEFVV